MRLLRRVPVKGIVFKLLWNKHTQTIGSFISVVLLWEAAVVVFGIRAYILPRPTEILVTLFEQSEHLVGTSMESCSVYFEKSHRWLSYSDHLGYFACSTCRLFEIHATCRLSFAGRFAISTEGSPSPHFCHLVWLWTSAESHDCLSPLFFPGGTERYCRSSLPRSGYYESHSFYRSASS